MNLSNVAAMYNKLAALPFGKIVFSYLFSSQAPYFLTIRPIVNELKPGLGSATRFV